MSEKYSNWLAKLKKKYQIEIDNLKEEEYQYLIRNYRFEGSTLLFILTIELKFYELTILIVNHNSTSSDSCKYLGSLSDNIEESIRKIDLILDKDEELHSIKNNLLRILEDQLKRRTKPQGKGAYLGGGTIGRDSWFWFMFEGNLEDISIDDFFTEAIKEAKYKRQKKEKLDEDIKKRDISTETIVPLLISDEKVKIFINEMKKDLEKVKNNLPNALKQSMINRSLIIENGALKKYGFIPEESKACKIFGEIIPIENLKIQSDLDSRRFTIQIRGLYGYLIEEILKEYITNPSNIEEYFIKIINEFIISYKTKKIPYKILLPLNGIIADIEESNIKYTIPFSDKSGIILFDDTVIIAENNDLILGRSVHYRKNDTEEGLNHAIAIYCEDSIDFRFIEQNSHLFSYDKSEPRSINDSELWAEIFNIFSSFILSNFKIGYSRQFYEFPWWIPKKRYHYDFPTPNWLRDVMYFNPTEKMSIDRVDLYQIKDIIPESYRNITFLTPIDKARMITFKPGNIADGFGFFKIDQGRSYEMGYQEISLKIPSKEFEILRRTFLNYSNKKNPINFYSTKFIINQLIKLRLREKVEDAILDSCLIIESLLISKEVELAYRFRLHASLLISNNIAEFKTNISFFNDLYKLRSSIVHGEETWHNKYRKFLRNHTRWKFNKFDWNYELIEFTSNDVINLVFMKILQIIIRINEIGLNLKEIQKPDNLIAFLKFNPQNINKEEFEDSLKKSSS